ncbi:hypothetical protein EVAR_99666_1 [Eumeta japonica]|uniref:Uncharacterized protein n=1 Tax=Eumeta variegata TaxID=151549 RepID=A0A4C2A5V7_EUMVA|nr:hypothetical protein EVAR_99666_1 [Eumeta japonica]
MSIDLGNSNVQRKIEINTGPGLELPQRRDLELRAGRDRLIPERSRPRSVSRRSPRREQRIVFGEFFINLVEIFSKYLSSKELPRGVTEFQKAARIRETNLSLNSTEPRLYGAARPVFSSQNVQRVLLAPTYLCRSNLLLICSTEPEPCKITSRLLDTFACWKHKIGRELVRARNDDWGQAIVERLEQVTDLVAADAQYHNSCMKKLYQTPSTEERKKEVYRGVENSVGTECGGGYTAFPARCTLPFTLSGMVLNLSSVSSVFC